MKRASALVLAAVLLGVLAPATAAAQTGPTLTLAASVKFGERVVLSGMLTPAAGGETIEILDGASAVVASTTAAPNGSFEATIEPDGTDDYVAAFEGALSAPVTVRVRAIVSVRMSNVRLFDTVRVRGEVEPARPGQRVEVKLVVGDRVIDTKRAAMGAAGGFTAQFEVPKPGRYRARASFEAEDLRRGTDTSGSDVTPLPRLSSGDGGTFVRLLESRLVELAYRLAGANDGRYDVRTGDAVVAFHKVQGMERSFAVSSATWRRLAEPRRPQPRRTWQGFHVEVDQTRQVLYMVRDGEVTDILHVSTGAGGATHDGTFRVHRKLAGFSPNRLYYPSYFDGLRALHGWTEVPTYPASHGCVRIPYWNARWIYARVDHGDRVVVYH
ncbi:MAG TPA: L,D-transpeptidase family protein [Actinomycetota bacterium]|nr:L,D-transpeptidase family protein [Actinomycetota bacterium]